MRTAKVSSLPLVYPLHSAEFLELQEVFRSLEKPYGLGDILLFNRTYRRIYGRLGKEEKRRAEEFVDALVAGVERQQLASRIFGVV